MGRNLLIKSFSLLTVITLIEKLIAFVFQAIIASFLGTSAATDAYFTSSELFGVLEVTVVSTLTVVALNRFSSYSQHKGEKEAFGFLSNLLSFYMPITIVLSIIIFVFADSVSYIIAPGFSAETRHVLVKCIRIMACLLNIECVTSIGLAVLRQKRRFVITGLKSLFISVVGIIFIFAFFRTGMSGAVILAVAYIVSSLLFCVLTMSYTGKYGKIRLHRPTFNAEIKETIKMVLPLIASYGITRTTLMIGKIVASVLGDGAVSQLTYANSLYAVVTAVFITNLSTILLTDFNEMFAAREFRVLGDKIKSVVSVMTMLLIPITVVSVVCSRDIVRFVFERGEFNTEATALVAEILAVYALSFIPAMIHGIYNQVLYANGDTKTPMWIAIISIAVNLLVSFLLIEKIGLSSVALASLISSLVAVSLCRIKVRGILTGFTGCYSVRFICSCIVGTAACVAMALLIKMLQLPPLFAFVLTTLACGATFVITLLLVKEKNAMVTFELVCQKFKK